jgi:hypothetical protein
MLTDVVCKISNTTASDLLVPHLLMLPELPTEEGAKRLAAELMERKGLYVAPDYLLKVLVKLNKAGY